MFTCPDCSHENKADDEYCSDCGAPLAPKDEQNSTSANAPPGEITPVVEETAENTLPEPEPQTRISVQASTKTIKGPVKENNQDYVKTEVFAFPTHGIQAVVTAGADGIGGAASGERWSQAAVHLFMAALGPRIPGFDQQGRFTDRSQFWNLLEAKLQQWFFPSVEWATKCVNAFGTQEMGKKLYGCTFNAAVTLTDVQTGKVLLWTYAVGDSPIFLITEDGAEKLTTDHQQDGMLTRFMGAGHPNADGNLKQLEFQLGENLPFLHILQCSDGLTNMLSPEEIGEICRKAKNPNEAVRKLTQAAVSVETPYGAATDPRVTPGDDNIFVGITSIRCKRSTR